MVVFDTASSIALFIRIFAQVYVLAIIAYILMSWIQLPYSLQPIRRFLYDTCEPYLAFWRRLLPFLRIGPIDLSAIVAILVLEFGAQVVAGVLD